MPVKSRNYPRREFRKAIRTQKLLEAIQSLSKKFRLAVRDHAKARKLSLKDDITRNATAAATALRKNFWGDVNCLLNDTHIAANPYFSADPATTYFMKVYSSGSHMSFEFPECLVTDPLYIGKLLFASVLHYKCKASSKPSPFDQIFYYILKKCPLLVPALLHL